MRASRTVLREAGGENPPADSLVCKALWRKSKWVKLHIAMDLKSGKLALAEATSEKVHDTSLLGKADRL